MAKQPRATDRQGARRWKSITSWVLIVLACLLAIVSVLVVFVRNEVLNTDTYVSTVTPLASNPAIQSAVAQRVTDALITKSALDYRVKQALPERAKFLATPITDAAETAANQIVLKLIESDKFQKLWVQANTRVHRQIVALLTGSSKGAFDLSNGKVTLDLSKVEAAAKKELAAKGLSVVNKLPSTNAPTLTLFQSTQLHKAQKLTRFANRIYLLLPILALALYAIAVMLSRNRRRGLVRAATGLALSMMLLLVVMSLLRQHYLSSLGPHQSRPAAQAVIDALDASLLDTVRTTLVVAAVVAIVAVAFGTRWVANRQRPTWMTEGPFHEFVAAHRKGLQWTVLGLGVLVLVVWSEPTARVAVVVVAITLVVVGLVGMIGGRTSGSGGPTSTGSGRRPGSSSGSTSAGEPVDVEVITSGGPAGALGPVQDDEV
jgi:hypothetical protein